MKLGTRAAAYGIAGLVLVGAVIYSGSALGLLNTSPSGVLSVLLVDPPSVPDGVSAIYFTYSDVAVHASGFGDSGWVTISGQGTIDTMGLVNFSQTISTGAVPSLTYNLVAFNISGVMVDFMGRNYSATVDSGRLEVPIVGGLKVNSSDPAAALVDIQPTVLNLGSQTAPNFSMATGAKALQIPIGEVDQSMKLVGNKSSLEGHGWFQTFRANHSDNLTSAGLSLTSNSFSFTVTNGGTDPLTVRMVLLTQDPADNRAGAALGAVSSSVVFAVESDGSLQLVSGGTGQVQSLLEASGYSLAAGATHQFSYTGAISSLLGDHRISSGTSYTVVVIGSETLSVQTVTAS